MYKPSFFFFSLLQNFFLAWAGSMESNRPPRLERRGGQSGISFSGRHPILRDVFLQVVFYHSHVEGHLGLGLKASRPGFEKPPVGRICWALLFLEQ